MSSYPRGSEWRRWDLHIHTPGTALADRYAGDWPGFVQALEDASEVAVVGVTDYLGLANYCKVRQLHNDGKFPHIRLIVPNIEFRVLPTTERHPGANVHLLVDPSDGNHVEKVERALANLRCTYNSQTFNCTSGQLAELGRAVHDSQLDDRIAYIKGVEQFRPDLERFLEWRAAENWLKENSILGVVGGADGLSGWSSTGALKATKENLASAADFIFSGRPGEINFWLLRKPGMDEAYARAKLRAPKPCLHGSDAHEVAKLFRPDLDRFCWIRADPTFEGLRQVLLEPELRVEIGPRPPAADNPAVVIDKVSIVSDHGWFETQEIHFNHGLVAIIGQKGSGKSALAELCAAACSAWSEQHSSFLKRAAAELSGLRVEITWTDGNTTGFTLGDERSDAFPRAKYLSQSFVETLCSGEDGTSDLLVDEIETVIFESLPEPERLECATFAELRVARTAAHRALQQSHIAKLHALIEEDRLIREKRALLPGTKAKLASMVEEISGLSSSLQKSAERADPATLERLQALEAEVARVELLQATSKKRIAGLEALRGQVKSFAGTMADFGREIRAHGRALGLTDRDLTAFRARLRWGPASYHRATPPGDPSRDSGPRGRRPRRRGDPWNTPLPQSPAGTPARSSNYRPHAARATLATVRPSARPTTRTSAYGTRGGGRTFAQGQDERAVV